MISIFDLFHDEAHYGYIVNTHYDYINMLNKMKKKNPQRFTEFNYSEETIYHHLDRIQQEQHLYD
jgi:hypothetical protein